MLLQAQAWRWCTIPYHLDTWTWHTLCKRGMQAEARLTSNVLNEA